MSSIYRFRTPTGNVTTSCPLEVTDKQLSRLSDVGRFRPWDRLVKFGTGDSLTLCLHALCEDADVTRGESIDEYINLGGQVV